MNASSPSEPYVLVLVTDAGKSVVCTWDTIVFQVSVGAHTEHPWQLLREGKREATGEKRGAREEERRPSMVRGRMRRTGPSCKRPGSRRT